MTTTSTSPATTEQRLERLEAVEAARWVLARYAEACDAQDLDAIGGLFTLEAELVVPGASFAGRQKIVEFYRQAWTEDPSRKTHFITNVSAHVFQAGLVEVTSYFLYTAAGYNSSVLGWGEYRDEVATSGDRPRFTRKSIAIRRATDVREGWVLNASEANPVNSGAPA